jgi:hypothetical protein
MLYREGVGYFVRNSEQTVSVLKGAAAANFARGFDQLLKREGTTVYTKVGTRVPFGVYSMNKKGNLRKLACY